MALRCLIVDDSARFLQAASGLLEREGITVVGVASNGAEAIARAEELHPDVLLLDIDLGRESGFELAWRLAERTRAAQAPTAAPRVILISTHSAEDFADLIEASPVVGFLGKSSLSAGAIRGLL